MVETVSHEAARQKSHSPSPERPTETVTHEGGRQKTRESPSTQVEMDGPGADHQKSHADAPFEKVATEMDRREADHQKNRSNEAAASRWPPRRRPPFKRR